MSKRIENIQAPTQNTDCVWSFTTKENVNQVTSLQKLALNYILKNVENVIGYRRPFLPWNVAELILEGIDHEYDGIQERFLQYFSYESSCLTSVRLNGTKVTEKNSMKFLKGHRIEVLEAVNVHLFCVEEWLCFVDNNHLKHLNISECLLSRQDINVIVGLTRFHNLLTLDVSLTAFNNQNLKFVVDHLPLLQGLNLSQTKVTDLEALKNLQHLKMFVFKGASDTKAFKHLKDIKTLKMLDITSETWSDMQKNSLKRLLENAAWPSLRYIDISGDWKCDENIMKNFVKKHPKLTFLGVLKTNCESLTIFDPNHKDFYCGLETTGSESLKQLISSLKTYKSYHTWCFECICKFFHINLPPLDNNTLYLYCESIKTLTDLMNYWKPTRYKNTEKLNIHMGGLACLYNLTKDEPSLLPLQLISVIVDCCLDAVECGIDQEQLVKNGLMILCSDYILNSVRFNRYRCLKTVLDVMLVTDNEGIIRMSVAICSILASQLTTKQTAKLGRNSEYITKMISLVRSKVYPFLNVDYVLRFTLSALWNITDECLQTCRTFIKQGGLEVFKQALTKVDSLSIEDPNVSTETKLFGLLNNIAEIPELRLYLLIDHELMRAIIQRLKKSNIVSVAYFAAGILANIIIGYEIRENENYNHFSLSRKRLEYANLLAKSVESWPDQENEVVAYRSFKPFIPLLKNTEFYGVQLWALWAIGHVCKLNGKRYLPMFQRDGILDVLQERLENSKEKFTNSKLTEKANEMISYFEQNRNIC